MKAEAVDLLGPLGDLVGPKPADPKQDAKRKWKGHGFNLIWRPNFDRSEGSEFGQKEFFLQLNLTDEELDFTEITGTGNRQPVTLSKIPSPLVGLPTPRRSGGSSTSRGSILSPGFGLMCQRRPIRKSHQQLSASDNSPRNDYQFAGHCNTLVATPPTIRRVSRRSLSTVQTTARPALFINRSKRFRSDPQRKRSTHGLQHPLISQNPNLFLSDALVKQTVLSATVLRLTSDTKPAGSVPDLGGGTANIASHRGGNPANGRP